MLTLLMAVLCLAFAVVLAFFLLTERNGTAQDEPEPCTQDDPRCKHVATRLQDARERMRLDGIPLLLGHNDSRRESWPRVTGGPGVIPFRRLSH